MAGIDDIRAQFNNELKSVSDLEKIQLLETSYLGRNGKINVLLAQMKSITPEERKKSGQEIKLVKPIIIHRNLRQWIRNLFIGKTSLKNRNCG